MHRYKWSSDWKLWYNVTMNGWFEVAKISCSARARLILLRLIISFFESTARYVSFTTGIQISLGITYPS